MELNKVKLGDLLVNFDYLRKPLSSIERQSFHGSYPYYGAQGIIDHVKEYRCDGEFLLIAEDGENLSSRSEPIAQIAKGKFWVNNHAHVVKANDKADIRYICYSLNHSDITGYVTGAAQPKLSQANLNKITLNVPSLKFQRRIASILSAYDNLIENNNKRIRLLEQMAENLYKEWFVRFRFPGHEKAEFENGLPKGWKSIRIKELSQLKSGYAFKSEWFVEEGESVAKIKDIGGTLMDTSDFSHVDRNNCIKAKRFLLVEGNLTIALTGATIGKISIVPRHDGNIYTNQRLGKFFMGDNPIENLPFLYCLFKQEAMVSTIINISNSSSAQPNISPEQIENLKIIGNKEAITKFNEALKPMFSMILSIHSQNEQLTRQRDLLLPRLMSGKLEVKV